MKMRKAVLALVMSLSLVSISGCDAYQGAMNTANVVGNIVKIAQADLPQLQTAGIISATELPIVTGYLGAVQTADGAAITCINAAGTSAKKSAVVTCLNAIVTAVTAPALLTQLRILNPALQNKIELWIVGVQLAVAAFTGLTTAPPVLTAAQYPTHEELADFRSRVLSAQNGE